MKIVIFDKYFGYNVGGAQRSLHTLVAGLKGQDITFLGCEVKKSFGADRFKIESLPIARFPILECQRFPYLEYLVNRSRIKKYFSNRTEQILITQGLWGAAAARFFPGKVIYFIRDEYQLNRIPFYNRGIKKIIKFFYLFLQLPGILIMFADNRYSIAKSKVVANSAYIAAGIKKNFGVIAEVIYPPLETKLELSGSSPLLKNEGYLTVIGSEYMKGRAIVESLAMAMPYEQFMIVGREFSKRVHRSNIVYEPWSNNIQEIYAKTKIILVPSVCAEGFCRVALEAMSIGIPVISSDRGGLPEVVDENCLISDIWDIGVWREKILAVKDGYDIFAKKALDKSRSFETYRQIKKFIDLVGKI